MSTSEIVYRAIGGELWIAMIGIIGDWTFPKDLIEEFRKEYPELLPPTITSAPQALFDSPFSWMIRCYQFNLKGRSKEYSKSVELLSTVRKPNELTRDNPSLKHIFKQYDKYNTAYQELLKDALKVVGQDPLIVFVYSGQQSFTGELANELLYKFPDKIIVVARNKNGEYKCSFRSSPNRSMYNILQKALQGIEGRGGGHDQACGGSIAQEDWEQFLQQLREQVQTTKNKQEK
jgi:single-stranded DNA-specific DHH superfamily exonuclease